jgi:protein tyrosine/serine phosphatase
MVCAGTRLRGLPGIISLALGLFTSCPPSQVYTNGVPNLREVDPAVYRGGQPRDEGWGYLHSLGIKTVVKLNQPVGGSDEMATRFGMTVIALPIPPTGPSDTRIEPDESTVASAVAALMNRRLRPLFIHCDRGVDRTGLVVGLYRVLHDHWPKDRAYHEMLENGFHPQLHGLRRFWEQFDGTLPGIGPPR